jgi:hypothetical protein
MREHGLGPFGRGELHPRRNPLDRQGRLAPQPGSAGQLAGVAPPASGQLGILPAPARQLLRDDAGRCQFSLATLSSNEPRRKPNG